MAARKAKFSEHSLLLSWLRDGIDHNMFDEGILDYPKSEVLVAPADHPTTCLPIYLTLTLDSLGHDKDADARQRLAATLECLQMAIEKARENAINEIYYIASDGRVDKTAERLGFKPVWCYRMKI